MESNNMESKLGYFMVGMSMGVIAGLLFAPRSGEEMRKIILDKAEEGTSYIKNKAQELGDRAEQAIDKGKEWVDRSRESAEGAFESGRQAYRDEKR
ncbi:MAG TPA: YtxH domain-containing protein [Gammaproteobacteria bacterium]|nr:YtxH domain-containing protein [Gammaproteobacteria bacterium]